MSFYQGYSSIGNLFDNDYWKEYMEKMAQKAMMERVIEEDLLLYKAYFYTYLQHSYAISSLPPDQQKLSKNIRNQFEGKARNTLIDRLEDNIREALFLDKDFQRFLEQFS